MLVQAKKSKSKKRGRPAKPRPIYVSKKLEIAYTRALITVVDDIHKTTVNELKNVTELHIGDNKIINDGLFDNIMQQLEKIKSEISTIVGSKAKTIASIFVNGQKKQSDKQLVAFIIKQTGLDLTSVMTDEVLEEAVKEAIQANVSLIKSIPEQYLYRVEQVIMAGLQSGQLAEHLETELQKIHKLTQNRAKLIASDQMGKINSRMTQIRQQSLGITHYEWRTCQDERVRHTHSLRNGKIYAWDKPPSDGHAGQAIRCRCVALPYFGDDGEEVMEREKSVLGNVSLSSKIENIAKTQTNTLLQQSLSLVTDNMGDLTRHDLPHGIDGAKGWTGGIMGLRKSESLMEQLEKEGRPVPPSWAIHHWSIDSSYLVDRYRKSEWITDEMRLKMTSVTDKAHELIKDIFSDDRAIIDEPMVLYRGISLDAGVIGTYENKLKNGNSVLFDEHSFNSNTLNKDLAINFAFDSSKRNGSIPVIHKTYILRGVRGIDITELNYYDEQEVLLENNLTRVIIAMKKNDNGSIELTSVIRPKPIGVGDRKPQNDNVEINIAYPNDPHMNKVSGVCASYRTGGKLSDITLD